MGAAITTCLVPFINSIFTGLSGLSCLFFMIGAIGNTNVKENIKNIPWLYLKYAYGTDMYYSLKAQYRTDFDTVVEFSQCAGFETRCDKCESDGHSAYVLAIISCLTALSCAGMCGAMIKNPDFTFMKFVAAIFASVSTLMAGIALSLFMGDCQNRIIKYVNDANIQDVDYFWGSGSILVATGMCFMFFVAVGLFTSAKFCAPSGDRAQPLAANELNDI